MNFSETSDLLTYVARVDNRRHDDATVIAWQGLLADLDIRDATNAVTQHFQASDEYLMPVHIRRRAERIREERQRLEIEAERRLELEAYAKDAGPLTDRSAEIRDFVAGIRSDLPPGDKWALNPRKEAWRQQHIAFVRQRDGEPNPRYRGIAPEGGWPMPEGTEAS